MIRTKFSTNPPSELIDKINDLIDEHFLIMIEQKDGKVFFLRDHWKYLRWNLKATRELIGEGRINLDRFVYLTKKIPIILRPLKRTRFA